MLKVMPEDGDVNRILALEGEESNSNRNCVQGMLVEDEEQLEEHVFVPPTRLREMTREDAKEVLEFAARLGELRAHKKLTAEDFRELKKSLSNT